MKTIEVICSNKDCNKKFYKSLYNYNQTLKRNGKHYCSLKCTSATPQNKLKIIGKTFNELTCIKELPKPTSKYKASYYLFSCSCGNEHKASGSDVRSGRIICCRVCKILKTRGKNNILWTGSGEISGGWWYGHVIQKANKRKLKIDISVNEAWNLFINQHRKCILSGLLLYFPIRNCDIATASLDRIDSSKGYIKGNVQWVHKDINTMKMNKTDDKFIKLCNLVAIKHKMSINQIHNELQIEKQTKQSFY